MVLAPGTAHGCFASALAPAAMASSWASIAKAVPKPAASPAEDAGNSEGLRLMVVDANVIISGLHLEGVADRAVTIQEVLDEIRDKKSRQFLATLPYQLQISEPTEESIKQVTRFARATGDIAALSPNDIKLLALAHTLEVAAHGSQHLHLTPSQPRMHSKGGQADVALPGWGEVPNPQDWRAVDEANEADEAAAAAAASTSRIATHVQQLSLDPSQPDAFLADDSSQAQPSAAAAAAAPKKQQKQRQQKASAASPAAAAPAAAVPAAAGAAAEGAAAAVGDDNDGEWEVAASSNNAARRRRRKQYRRQERQQAFEQEWAEHAALVQQQQQPEEQPQQQQQQQPGEAAREAAGQLADDGQQDEEEEDEESEQQQEEDEDDDDDAAAEEQGDKEESDAEFLAGQHQVFTADDEQQQQGGGSADGASGSVLSPGMPGWQSSVACVTADFAMQNVLLQMGLRLLTRDGRRINRLSRYALRCSACFTVTREAGRLFCPKCGNLSLDRVEVVVGPDGAEFFGVKKRHVLRGTKYSLPKPKGGRNSSDPVLREDVFLLKVKALGRRGGKAKKETGEVDAFAPEFSQDTWHSGVASQRELAQHRGLAAVLTPSWKNNPNERKLTRSNRRG